MSAEQNSARKAYSASKPIAGEQPRRMPVGRPFTKGASGNPGGRPVIPADVVALAKGHTALAIATLAAICERPKASAAAKVAAAVALLDRAWGKPVQPYESKNLNVNVNAYSDAELLAIVARARATLSADTLASDSLGVAMVAEAELGAADSVAGG